MDSNLPGTVPRATTPHPRRPPAHKSVSLRHSPPAAQRSRTELQQHSTTLSSPTVPASDKANPPSSLSPHLATNKHSSGESSDAGKWFEKTNNNAAQANAPFIDNDPPFFLRNSSSSNSPPEGQERHPAYVRAESTTMPYRTGLMQMGTEGSSGEDFRSVIDDLTIANKKLKARLKKYEQLYDAPHLQDEKLFEVRFHGLPDHKKKELEETLRKFAADLDNISSKDLRPISYAPPLDTYRTAASSASRFAESGYASLSASGQNSSSTAPSGPTSGQNSDRQTMSKSQYNQQQQSIQSYLHDIPVGLLPRHSAPMTEKAKKKAVVRRLEQIFAGKQSAPSGNHSQPIQQEEVAQSAAMADRREREASGQQFRKEGLREARIAASNNESTPAVAPQEDVERLRTNEQDWSGSYSPDQRPTRPLDLDPYRAQIPQENMDYIRHLGFTPPGMLSDNTPQDGHGWIYLNLLANMAQLHTINVTLDFVKDAITDYSSKFELSRDGRKVRWKGLPSVSMISDTSSEQPNSTPPTDPASGTGSLSPSKRLKTEHGEGSLGSSIDPEMQAQRAARAAKEKDRSKFAYVPLFYHRQDSEEDDDYRFGSSSNSPLLAQQRGDSSGLGSSAMRSSSSRKRRDDGPMIFYNKAKFITDLSGDRRGPAGANPSTYESIRSQPLGMSSEPQSRSSTSSIRVGIGEPRGPMDATPMDIDSQAGDNRAMSSDSSVHFSAPDLHNDSMSEDNAPNVEFEASGLGGVQPDDNFAIRVRRSQARVESSILRAKATKPHLYPKKILDVLNQERTRDGGRSSRAHPTIKEEILSTSRKDLPSSSLPPASFLPFDSTSSGDLSDVESNVSSSPSSGSSSLHPQDASTVPQSTLPMHLSNAIHQVSRSTSQGGGPSDGSESDEFSDGDADSDDSVDFLATARMIDPTHVRDIERVYDADLAERFAEEIPAGSSAATAGGGSGFNSPIAGVTDTGSQSVRRASAESSSSTRAKLKRARTGDSLAAAAQPSSKTQKTD